MLLSQNRTLTTIPHPMGPPSVTVSDCPSESINKWNLVSFHEPGTNLSSIDVYIEPCPRFECFAMPMIDVYAPADLFPAGADGRLGRSSQWPFSAPRAWPPQVPSTSTTQ